MLPNSGRNVPPLEPLVPQSSSYRVMYEALRKQGYKHYDGHHLASEGAYRETVTAMCVRNPNLRWSHIEYTATRSEYGKATVLELRGSQPFGITRLDFESSQSLSDYLAANSPPSNRRVILLEGLARNYVDVLGSHFNMDPSLFASQKRPNSWQLGTFNLERTSSLPSLNDPMKSFMIRYPELRHFPLLDDRTQLNSRYVKDLDGHRRVDISRRTREKDLNRDREWGDFGTIGIVNRAASYWSRKYENGSWDSVLLLDPPAKKIVRTTPAGEILAGPELKHLLFRGGYCDFIPYPEMLDESRKFIKEAASQGPGRTSILEDICFYFTNHQKELTSSGDENDPSLTTVFLKKIAATNWIHLVDYFRASAHNLEYHFARNESFKVFTIPTIEMWWGDLHSWHRRCVQHCEEVDAIFVSLKIPLDWSQAAGENTNPMDSYEDFAFIHRQLFLIKSRFEFLVNSANGLNAIAGNKEATVQNGRYARRTREESENSLREARKASILTFLATVFVPLAVTAGIFSMSSEWGPGGDKFGYYWAITIPIVLMLTGVYYILTEPKGQSKRPIWKVREGLELFDMKSVSLERTYSNLNMTLL